MNPHYAAQIDAVLKLRRMGFPLTVICPALGITPAAAKHRLKAAIAAGLTTPEELDRAVRQRPGGRAGRGWSPKNGRMALLGQLLATPSDPLEVAHEAG
jgi:hypothetical protein